MNELADNADQRRPPARIQGLEDRRLNVTDELACNEFVELVTDYLEGALPAPDRERFERHVVYCPGCSFYVDQLRETIWLTGRLSEESLPAGSRDALLRAFRDWKQAGGDI